MINDGDISCQGLTITSEVALRLYELPPKAFLQIKAQAHADLLPKVSRETIFHDFSLQNWSKGIAWLAMNCADRILFLCNDGRGSYSSRIRSMLRRPRLKGKSEGKWPSAWTDSFCEVLQDSVKTMRKYLICLCLSRPYHFSVTVFCFFLSLRLSENCVWYYIRW